MKTDLNRKLTEGEIEKAWFWLDFKKTPKSDIANHFSITIKSLNEQMGIKVDPLMEALNKMGKRI